VPITELLQGERACIFRIHMTNARTGAGRGAPRARRGAPVLRRRARRGRRAGRRQHAERKVRLARAREGLALRRGSHGGRACVHPPAPASTVGRLRSAAGEPAGCRRPLQGPCGRRPVTRSACARRCAVLPDTAAAAVRAPAACRAPILLDESLTSIRQLLQNEWQRWQQLCGSLVVKLCTTGCARTAG